MQVFIESVLQHSITFYAILDPIGTSAIMLSLLHVNITKKEIQHIALKTTITVIISFFTVLIAGNTILDIFNINENSIKVIGGIILIIMAIDMIQSSKKTKELSKEEDEDIKVQDDLSVMPIAIPITFGPGIFSTIIILKQQATGIYDIISIICAFLINAVLIYFIFKNSIYIKGYLGLTGQNIITKLMGLVVGAIAVQFIVSGLVELIKIYYI
jgi:multiple antibiotic resistance protein